MWTEYTVIVRGIEMLLTDDYNKAHEAALAWRTRGGPVEMVERKAKVIDLDHHHTPTEETF